MGNEAQAKYKLAVEDKTAGTLRAVEKNFKQHISKVSSYGKNLTMAVSAPIVAFGALSLKTTADFQTAMNRVEGVTGATTAEMAKLNAQAKALGASTSFSASEAGDAMGFLAQAGFKADQILGAMPSTLQLAEAAQMDLAAAADITSNILAGYGKKVEDLTHINDVLVKAADATNTDIAGLGEAMSYVAPVASGMGLAFEETVGALGMLSNAGIKGSMAGTTLREVLGSLANPSKEAAELLEKMAISAFDSQGKMRPLADIMGQLQMAGMTAGEALQIFGQRAGPGMLALVNQGAGALTDLQATLEDSGGAAKHMAEVQMKGLNGALKNLQSAFEGLQIALMESGILDWVTNFVTRVAGWISTAISAGDSTHRLALVIAGMAAAIGPTLLVVGKLVGLISFLTSPIGMVIGAVGLLTLAWNRWGDDIRKIVSPVTNWLKDKFDEVAGFVLLLVASLLKGLAFLFEGLSKLPGQIGEDMGAARDALNGWSDSIAMTRYEMLKANDGAGAFDSMMDRIKSGTQELLDKLKGLGDAAPAAVAASSEIGESITNIGEAAEVSGTWIGWMKKQVQGLSQMSRGIGLPDVKKKVVEVGWVAQAQAKIMHQAFADAAEGLASSFADAVFQAENLLEGLANTARSVLSMLATGLIKLGLAKIFPSLAPTWGFVDKPKSSMTGGHLAAGQASWVGENGRELWIPDQSGTVVPASKMGGGLTINVPITIYQANGDITKDPIELRRLAIHLRREFEALAKMYFDPSAQAGV